MTKELPTPEHKRVFIVVKTIPTESLSYEETVCTAGITDSGKWIRLYPVPFRKLPQTQRYSKYQWIDVDTFDTSNDFRPESRKCDCGSIILGEKIESWEERKKICISSMKVYTDFNELISKAKDKNDYTSLAVFKPTKILDCFCVPKNIGKIEKQLEKQKEIRNFHTNDLFNTYSFNQAKPLPVYIKYKFTDSSGKERNLSIEDWEAYELYRKYNNPEEAQKKVIQKYMNYSNGNFDIYFFVGTRMKDQLRTPNPFSIIGIFCPPKDEQPKLF